MLLLKEIETLYAVHPLAARGEIVQTVSGIAIEFQTRSRVKRSLTSVRGLNIRALLDRSAFHRTFPSSISRQSHCPQAVAHGYSDLRRQRDARGGWSKVGSGYVGWPECDQQILGPVA